MWHLAYTLLHNPSRKELREKQEHTACELATEHSLFTVVDNSIRHTVNEEKNNY